MKPQVEIVNMAQHRDEKRAEAIIRKGQCAWTQIKATAEEQRTLWLEVGVALMYGRQQNPSNQAFGRWCEERGFDMDAPVRSDAIWWAEAAASYDGPKTLTHPTALRKAHREQQATQALPVLLQEIAPTSTPVLTQRDAERVAKTIHRAASGDEGAETALRHLGALAKKHGMTVEGLTDSAKTGAPDIYFRFAPQLQGSIDQFRLTMEATVTQMEQQGVSRDAIKHILINIAHSI